jgi:hypothetical protein
MGPFIVKNIPMCIQQDVPWVAKNLTFMGPFILRIF